MGAVKSLFGGIGRLFGGGGDDGDSTPKIEKVAPAPVSITGDATSGEAGNSTSKARKRRGYTSTLSKETLAGAATDAARKLLG